MGDSDGEIMAERGRQLSEGEEKVESCDGAADALDCQDVGEQAQQDDHGQVHDADDATPTGDRKKPGKKEARVSWTNVMISTLIECKSAYHARAGSALVNGKKKQVQWKVVCDIFNKKGVSPFPITQKQAANKWSNVRPMLASPCTIETVLVSERMVYELRLRVILMSCSWKGTMRSTIGS